MVAIEMLVNQYVADEIRQKGLAEIALRRTDAKFKAIEKCFLLERGISPEEIPVHIAQSSVKLSIPQVTNIEEIRGVIRESSQNFKTLSTTTKNIAEQVDGLYQLTNTVKSISYLNTGLSLANMAIDIAGFVVMNEKLNILNGKTDLLLDYIKKIHAMKQNELIEQYQLIIMRCNKYISRMRRNEEVAIDAIDELLEEIRAFISKMINNYLSNALQPELVFKVVFSILPTYTFLLNECIKRYHYEKNILPDNYDHYMSIYNELENSKIKELLRDYYFLQKKFHFHQVIDIINTQTLLSLNGRVLIEDQVSILNMLETKEKVEQFEIDIFKLLDEKKKLLVERIPITTSGA